ncbi:MAG TPA: NAD(P)-dependent oxidoreductase [Acholeplasma sp.]|nr:NAD(P)-dependent oxidoreductase [Acholeplasma sp.]
MKIGFIGSGVMGYPMIKHLAKMGHTVNVYNRTQEKTKGLEGIVSIKSDIISTVTDVDVVFSIVGYPKDVKDIYEIIIPSVSPNTILVDMTTSSPSLAIILAKKALDRGIFMLDAPVTGGDLGARNQTLSIMVGGDFESYQKVVPLLAILGSTVTHVGGPGFGQHTKMANQITIAGNIAGIAEGISYAKSKGLNLDLMYQVVTNGSATSWQAVHNGLKMINKDYEPGFYIKHFLKDLKIAIVEKDNLSLPVLEQVKEMYQYLSADFDDKGTQALIEYYLIKNNL